MWTVSVTKLPLALVCICILCGLHTTTAAKLLFVPMSVASHVMYFKSVADEARAQGHEVHWLLSPSFPAFDKMKKEYSAVLGHHTPDQDFYSSNMTEEEEKRLFLDIIKMSPVDDFRTTVEPYLPFCTNALSDDHLLQTVQKNKYDLGIVDAVPITRCMYILLYRLDIPYVSLTTHYEPWLFRSPSLPSFVPNTLGTTYTDSMNFWQRLYNLWANIRWVVFITPNIAYLKDELVTKYAPEKEPVSLDTLAGRSLLWFLNSDVALDYARPTMPNVIEVGGLTLKEPDPMPEDLQRFMDSAKKGVIVVSFGTLARYLPDDVMAKLFSLFLHLEESIVWRYANEQRPKNIPARMKLLPWIPQAALLKHPNTKLFVTHGGNNGQFEALYHGVPMLCMPLFGDQPYNARRAEYKGFGLASDILQFTPDEVIPKIKELIQNPSYRTKIEKASQIYRDRPLTAVQRALFWMEHVIKYGGHHLRSYALDMPWYQYLMLDILCFVLLCVIISTSLLSLLCVTLYKKFCRSQKLKTS